MNFDELITISDWNQALQQLVSLAKNAVQQNNQADIGSIQDLLIEYQRKSPPSMNSLDEIAFKTANELNQMDRERILNELSGLSAELINLNRLVAIATEQALLSSEEIQLKNTKEVLTKAKISLGVLKGLREDIQDDSTPLGKKVEAVFKAIADFEQAFSAE